MFPDWPPARAASCATSSSPIAIACHCSTPSRRAKSAFAPGRARRAAAVPRGVYRSEALRALYGRYSMAPGQGRLVADEDYAEPRMTGSQFQRLVQDMGLMQPNGGWVVCVRAGYVGVGYVCVCVGGGGEGSCSGWCRTWG